MSWPRLCQTYNYRSYPLNICEEATHYYQRHRQWNSLEQGGAGIATSSSNYTKERKINIQVLASKQHVRAKFKNRINLIAGQILN